jgi:hypothetical protein
MALATSLQKEERNNYNFITVFNNAPKTNPEDQSTNNHKIHEDLSHLQTRLNNTEVLTVAAVSVIPTAALFVSNKYKVTLKLSPAFSKHFVLLRGLFEFSQPKTVVMSSSTKDQIFEVEMLETQIDHVLSYIETILTWLRREIKFKEALATIIRFEKRVKEEQASLYSKLLAAEL